MLSLRPCNLHTDFPALRSWIADERAHALWCANRFIFPLEEESFERALAAMEEKSGEIPFAAVDGEGKMAGFFVYAFDGGTQKWMHLLSGKSAGAGAIW